MVHSVCVSLFWISFGRLLTEIRGYKLILVTAVLAELLRVAIGGENFMLCEGNDNDHYRKQFPICLEWALPLMAFHITSIMSGGTCAV